MAARCGIRTGSTFNGIAWAPDHLLIREFDHGPTVARRKKPVLPSDTVEMLAACVLAVRYDQNPGALRAEAR